MSFFNNLKMSAKLGILIAVAFLSLGIVGGVGYYNLQQADARMGVMYLERFLPNDKVTGAYGEVRAVNSYLLELMLTTDAARNQELKKAIDASAVVTTKDLGEVEKLPLDDKAKRLLANVREAQQKYRQARTEIIDLALQNKNAEAYALYVAKLQPLAQGYSDGLGALSDHYTNLGKQMADDSSAAAALATKITLMVFLLACVMLGAGGLVISRAITKPLQAMVGACQEFAGGDFREKPRRVVRTDEIGQLADALADMRTAVRTALKQVNESSEQVAASSEELTASAEQSAAAVTQIAGSINNIAQGADKQQQAVDNTSSVVQQMSAGIQQTAASSNQVAVHSALAAEKATEGNRSVGKAVEQMVSIEQTVNNSAKVVSKLGERSKEIGQIVDTISGIAGQTNLLALNAAIEAARAGEQGRGFAVVAEEVRKLAEQSQDAAKQIADLIGEIQEDTDKAVVAMEEGTQEVKVGAQVVTAAGKAFAEIAHLVSNVSAQIKEISVAMEEMATGSQQIVQSVQTVSTLSNETTGESQSVSAATQEQSASMQEIASASQGLAKLAEGLRVAVAHFRL